MSTQYGHMTGPTIPMAPAPIDQFGHALGHAPASNYPRLQSGIQPAPETRSLIENGRKYELRVVQQPRRARMCGFGDKDRRPITPPPCVRLIITDISSGKEVDCNEIDHGMFVLNVDLWNDDGSKEVNLVKHSPTSPAISSTMPVSFTYVANAPGGVDPYNFAPASQMALRGPAQGGAPYNPFPQSGPPPVNPYSQPHQNHPSAYTGEQYPQGYAPTTNGAPYPQNGYQPPGQNMFYSAASIHQAGHQQPQPSVEYSPPMQQYRDPTGQRGAGGQAHPTGMFTRNLIGSLAASAFRLTDPDDRIGIWFVLQDLSVRTEGHFRLRFSFVNVGIPPLPGSTGSTSSPPGSSSAGLINTGKAPVLASCFSEGFTVYSAKKFPGVVESTPLSKCFATQGIKIPIRKDGPGGKEKTNREEYEGDD